MMDRIALLIAFGVGLLFGRMLDRQWLRDVRRTVSKRIHGEPWEYRIRADVKKRRAV